MTKVKFLFSGDTAVSFEISGHSGAGKQGGDIVKTMVVKNKLGNLVVK